MVILEGVLAALEILADPVVLGFILLGTVMGLTFGALPGLGGATAIALLIPLTFGLDPYTAFVLMAAAQGGATFGGSISAILINVPGTAPNAATLLDGHPLTQKGEANVALGASAASSAIGALIGLGVLVLSLPIIRQVLRLFGSPEFFLMALFGLVILGVVTEGPLINGLIAGSIGVLISFVGMNPVTGGTRFTFGTTYLLDGLSLIPIIIGLFAIGELLKLHSENKTIAAVSPSVGGSALDGVRAAIHHKKVLVKSAIIGTIIGLVPAVGGVVANFIAYMNASQSAENNEEFGKGDIRGVIASESANDAKDGGAMIPTIAFGIPGSAVWAVILGAFIVHGFTPGPRLLEEEMSLIFLIIIALLISNVLTSVIGVLSAKHISKITNTDINLIGPPVIGIALLGAYIYQLVFMDVVVAAIFGILGYLMILYSISRVSLLIGFVLGPLAEVYFHQSLQLSQGSYTIFFESYVSLIIIGAIVLSLAYALNDIVGMFREKAGQ